MASWTDAAPALPSHRPRSRSRPRPKPAPKRRPQARRGVAGGVVWIAIVAVLLAGVVALNVAVLRLNVQLDKLDTQRADLRAENQSLASQLAMAGASPRIQLQAEKQFGLVPADPAETTYVRLGPRAR
jgi:cell division protein FtsL